MDRNKSSFWAKRDSEKRLWTFLSQTCLKLHGGTSLSPCSNLNNQPRIKCSSYPSKSIMVRGLLAEDWGYMVHQWGLTQSTNIHSQRKGVILTRKTEVGLPNLEIVHRNGRQVLSRLPPAALSSLSLREQSSGLSIQRWLLVTALDYDFEQIIP